MTHHLKTWPGEFEAVARDDKRHEVRLADRDFHIGDTLILREFVPALNQTTGQPETNEAGETLGAFTGRQLLRRVSYITLGGSWGLPAELCILSIKS